MSSRRFIVLLALALIGLFSPATLQAQQTDVIRGRVTGPDSLPIENATVTVTSISGAVNRSTRTNKDGRYTVTFPGGDGDYMISFAALGFNAKRFEIKRVADEDVLIADARLTRGAVALDAVKVQAPREKVARNDVQPDVSGTERPVNNAALPPADLGDLAAMAATLPGVQLVPGENGDPNGFSVLGLGADQNSTTLNGMNFGGANLPRDAALQSSLVTSPYDVSRGGFSGGQFNLRTRPGSNFIMRGMSVNLDAPQMQWTDRAARSLGQQYSNVSVGGMLSGPIVLDKAFYNLSYQVGRRSNDYQSLLNTDALGLKTAGVAADSVTRLLNILAAQNIPTYVPGRLPSNRLNDQGSFFGSVDFAPPGSTSGQAFNTTFNAGWNRQNPSSALTTALPANSGDRTNWNAGIQGRHNSYFGFGILTETSVSLSESRTYSTPYLEMPGGSVRVNSTFDDGSASVQTLSFGGNPFMSSSFTSTSAGAMNQLSWFSRNNKHRLKLTSELRRDGYTSDQTSNLLGSFSYNSLADLQANQPSAFSRTLAPRTTSASQLTGAVSLGDSYRRTNDLQIQYGVRLDANRFLNGPQVNPQIEQLFGTRNNSSPNRLYVSPRVGFSWTYGQAAQIASFDGAFRGPRAVVRGGIGVFQNMPGTQAIGAALDNTGLASAIQQLNCVGPATPAADWQTFATNLGAVPRLCADGTGGTVFANSAPNVTMFSPDYAAPRSVRSNLQWNGPVLNNRLSATIEATYSSNLNQSGMVDLNFAPNQQFTLADEANRPVYVRPGSIVPATGAVASRDARVSPLYSQVREMRSDLRSESRQLSLRVAPVRFSTSLTWNAAYVYSNVRERVRGFSGTTAGNPLEVEWARSPFDSRHQITYNIGYNLFNTVTLNWFGRFASGNPFTPTVSGDVNGDGYADDRAFIFNPSTVGDQQIANGMQALLANGSEAARSCLRKQLGGLAARNSCEGPWTSTANLSITFNPVKVRMPQRASISFNISNPLGAADLLMHGENNLHGWGQNPFIDRSLLYVRGFDPATNRYKYEVNQRFGATNPAFNAFRSPVTLTAMMRFDIGPTRERQALSMQLDRGRTRPGDRIPEQFIKAMYSNSIMNPMAAILRSQDSLHLTAPQADSIAMINRWYLIRVDSIWSPVSKFLSGLPERYDQGEAYEHYVQARRATVDVLTRLAPAVKGLLTAEQHRKLPSFVASYLEPRYLASIRSGTAGYTGGGMPGLAMGGGDRQVIVGGAGGGGVQTIIIR